MRTWPESLLFLLCLLFAGVASARGQAAAQSTAADACPWLTQGTAARVLGGEVSVTVRVTDSGDGVCSFVRNTDAMRSLRIEVSKAALPACAAGAMLLKGIGNEARRCSMPAGNDSLVDKISGRVRDRYFNLTMSYRAGPAPHDSVDLQDDALEQAAESVAGNLF